jgi:hypothetical protein
LKDGREGFFKIFERGLNNIKLSSLDQIDNKNLKRKKKEEDIDNK